MTVGIILAAGKGTRFKAEGRNKAAVDFRGKPLVCYGTDLFARIADRTVVVLGKYPESVKAAIGKKTKVTYAVQRNLEGTGAAVKTAVAKIAKMGWKPTQVWVGYADHMMFYEPGAVKELRGKLAKTGVAISMVSFTYPEPEKLALGRVVRAASGGVTGIVENKDATAGQKSINEFNAGLYCFDYAFLAREIKWLEKSPASGEYYLTDMIKFAVEKGKKIETVILPYEKVGVGINTREELEVSEKLYFARTV
jgi:bifunctional UDP-N-acetylglucosamine pyrophosphorylase / glucosamine-1-phosphate N-acetyltransferase